MPTGRTFHAYFNPQRPMPLEAEQVHGLCDSFLADKPRFREGVLELLDFMGDSPLVAHNAQFDFGFLNHELDFCGHPCISLERMVDTLSLARRRHPGAKHSLDALCSRYGIDRSHRLRHGALLDAELLAQVYVELTGGRQIGLGLVAERVETVVQVARFSPARREFRQPRFHAASAEELARHKAFVETLDSPLWAA
jgi:DNA polymerase-3 subunit epsilon